MSTYSIQQGDYSQINKDIRISIITAEFNQIFTKQLEEINIKFLESEGFTNINTYQVPGAFEIPGLANKILSEKKADLILCFGVV
ncbi:MAG: hypothetical protein GY828_01035, partial [Candidatus Gracilibacteria bacterium]|nr:hypothetical protein [Candidatus Gracilibacteria bacterium]